MQLLSCADVTEALPQIRYRLPVLFRKPGSVTGKCHGCVAHEFYLLSPSSVYVTFKTLMHYTGWCKSHLTLDIGNVASSVAFAPTSVHRFCLLVRYKNWRHRPTVRLKRVIQRVTICRIFSTTLLHKRLSRVNFVKIRRSHFTCRGVKLICINCFPYRIFIRQDGGPCICRVRRPSRR